MQRNQQRNNLKLRQTIRQLQAQNQELDDFCTIVAHDLHGSVCGIVQSAVWLQERVAQPLDVDIEKRFDLLISRALWMDTLISDLLAYARMEQPERQCEPIVVAQLLNITIDCLSPPPEIAIQIAPNLPILYTERIPFKLVFSNLISNAIKYRAEPQGSISISGVERADCYEFSVTDDGLGIARQDHQKIFDLFTTLPKVAGGAQIGTGIGLAIVKKAVERHGGQISIESELGVGSTFRFTWAKSAECPR